MIISFVQTKGGVGKTNLARNIAYSKALRRAFPKVALVELDPQGNLKRWWLNRRNNPKCKEDIVFKHISTKDKNLFFEELETLQENNDLLILDAPGESKSTLYTEFACLISDVVVVPMQTSTDDEAAFEDNLTRTISETIERDPDQKGKFYIIASFVHPRADKRKVVRYLQEFAPPSVKVMASVVVTRIAFKNCARFGHNLFDYRRMFVKSSKQLRRQADAAIANIEEIAEEILQITKFNGEEDAIIQ